MTEDVQDEPVESGSTDATEDAKIAGILDQVRQDVAGGAEDPIGLLQQRLAASGITVSADRFDGLADRLTAE
jgi:peptidoglycan hydrolase-like protein with peptidoglycan-binding domain